MQKNLKQRGKKGEKRGKRKIIKRRKRETEREGAEPDGVMAGGLS